MDDEMMPHAHVTFHLMPPTAEPQIRYEIGQTCTSDTRDESDSDVNSPLASQMHQLICRIHRNGLANSRYLSDYLKGSTIHKLQNTEHGKLAIIMDQCGINGYVPTAPVQSILL